MQTQNSNEQTSQDTVSVLADVLPAVGAPYKEGSPASPGTCPIPVLISIQSEVV